MALSAKQKMLLHTVPQALGISDEERILIQRSLGGFHSAADPTAGREGFIAVMAHYESRSPGGQIAGNTPGYWQTEDRKVTSGEAGRQAKIAMIRKACAQLNWSDQTLNNFLCGPRMSSGLFGHADEASDYWLRKCLQALLAIITRNAGRHA
jgi:cytochrome c2